MTLLRGIGFAIYFGTTGNFTNCTLSNNYKTDIVAGGASVQSGSSASFTGCTFGNNSALQFGAGVYIAVGLPTDRPRTAALGFTLRQRRRRRVLLNARVWCALILPRVILPRLAADVATRDRHRWRV